MRYFVGGISLLAIREGMVNITSLEAIANKGCCFSKVVGPAVYHDCSTYRPLSRSVLVRHEYSSLY